jgi:hypothetical protein
MRSIASPTSPRRVAAGVAAAATLSPVAYAAPHAPPPRPQPKSVPFVIKVNDGGFRWGDAGIGAAGGFGAALVLFGSLALAGRRDRNVTHPPRPREEQQ